MYTTDRQTNRKLEIMERELCRLQEENSLLRESLASCNPKHMRKQLARAEESYQEYTALIQELLTLRQEYQLLNQELLDLRQEYQLSFQEAAGVKTVNRRQKQRGWPKGRLSDHHNSRR